MDIHTQLKRVTMFLADYAATLMAVGTQTSRVARNTGRIAESFGFHSHIMLFSRNVIITLQDDEGRHSYTRVQKLPALGLNFASNMNLSKLSWRAYDEHLQLEQLETEFKEIRDKKRESPWTVLILVSFANACFCRLFNGDIVAVATVWVATFVGFYIRQQLTKLHWRQLAVFIVSSFVASMIGSTGYLCHWGTTPDMALGTSMLYLVPGVPLINGIMDIIDGHVLAGTSRLINACMLIICIAIGLSIALFVTGIKVM